MGTSPGGTAAPIAVPSSPSSAGADASGPTRARLEAWDRELLATKDPLRQARIHYEIARIAEAQLRDLKLAGTQYQEALTRHPEHLPSIRGARRVHLARKQAAQALPLFDLEARLVSAPKEKATLYFEKGRVHEDVLGQRAEARAAYATALELERGDVTFLHALTQVDEAAQKFDELAIDLEREASGVTDPRLRAALLVQRARLIELRQKDLDAAIDVYEAALALDPFATGALDALKRLHRTQKRWRDLVRVLELDAAQTDDSEHEARSLARVGRILAERLGAPDDALNAFERAQAAAPEAPEVLAGLAALYEDAERHLDLVRVLERQAESAAPAERVALLGRIGAMRANELGDVESAIRAWEAALALGPTHVPTVQALERAYSEQEQWAKLAAMLVGVAEASDDPRRRATALARSAEIEEQRHRNVERAIEQHARALAVLPGHPPSFKALVRLLSTGRRWHELAELHVRAADAQKSPDAAIYHLLEAGLVFEHGLSDVLQAAQTYRRVLTLDSKHVPALWALQRTTERAGRWADHVEALEKEAALSKDPTTVLVLTCRAGEVLEQELSDDGGAVTRFRRALELDKSHATALMALGRLYHRLDRHDDLLDVYRRELELASDALCAAALLYKMGELAEKRSGKDDDAIGFYRRALEKDPTHGAALRALETKLRALGRFKEVLEVLDIELSTLVDGRARARLEVRMAELAEERLGQNERAISLYEAAREADAGHEGAYDALARLRVVDGSYRKLVDDHEREVGRLGDDSRSVAPLARAAQVWSDHLNEPRRAVAAWEKVLERDPAHLSALLALETLQRRLGAHEALATVLATQARTLGDTGARAAALRELGRVDETRLSRQTGAFRSAHEAVLGLLPDDPLALGALERIALEMGDDALLAAVDARLADRATNASVEATHRVRLAESLEESHPEQALAELKKALAADPSSLAAARGVSRCAELMHDPRATAAALRQEAALLEDRPGAARLLVRAGDISFHELGDAPGAVLDHERALELDPSSADAASRLLELLLAGGEAARAAERLGAAAAAAKSEERATELWSEVARLQADVLESVPAAIASLGRVLQKHPNHVPTLRRLAELYLRESAHAEAARLLARVVQLAPDREVLKDAHLELSAIYERTDERPRARVSILAVLAIDPQSRLALGRLASIEVRDGQLDKAVDAQRRRVAAALDPDDAAEALGTLAELETRRGRSDLAQEALREATVIEGPEGRAATQWRAILDALKGEAASAGFTLFASAIQKHIEAEPDLLPPRLALATLLGDVLGRHADASQVLRLALRAFPDALEVRRHLVHRLVRSGNAPDAIELARKVADENPSRAEAWRDVRTVLGPDTQVSQMAIAPLVLLGAAKPDELDTWRSRRAAVAPFRPGAFSTEMLAQIAGLDPNAPILSLLAALPEAAVKLWPLDLAAYGVTAKEKLTTRSGHPLRLLSDRIAAVFGFADHELYVHRVRGRGVVIEPTEPVTILIPQPALDLGEPAQAFLLARAFASASLRVSLVDKLTPRELEVFIASSLRPLSAGFGSGLTSEDVLDDQSKRIQKALSRRPRRSLEENAARYIGAPALDFQAFCRIALVGTARAALLVSDDLVQAVDVLRRTERDMGSLDPATLVRTVPLVTELVRFWASDAALTMRRRLAVIA